MKQDVLMALQTVNEPVLKQLSKIIALAVRNELEGFHVAHISDNNMKELNTHIRNAIYTILLTFAKSDSESYCRKIVASLQHQMPPYWEEPVVTDKQLNKILKNEVELSNPKFDSAFLNTQFALGNLFYNKNTGCMQILVSCDFKEVPGDKKSHRGKISVALKNEGYMYLAGLCGYSKIW
jgi:hypothetical protein